MRERKKGVRKDTCSKCGGKLEPNRVGKYRYCNPCHAAHMRSNRRKYSDYSEEEKKRANVRSMINVYIKRGIIERKPCGVCSDPKSEAHHDDYDRPFDIKWFCKKHHIDYHRQHPELV